MPWSASCMNIPRMRASFYKRLGSLISLKYPSGTPHCRLSSICCRRPPWPTLAQMRLPLGASSSAASAPSSRTRRTKRNAKVETMPAILPAAHRGCSESRSCACTLHPIGEPFIRGLRPLSRRTVRRGQEHSPRPPQHQTSLHPYRVGGYVTVAPFGVPSTRHTLAVLSQISEREHRPTHVILCIVPSARLVGVRLPVPAVTTKCFT